MYAEILTEVSVHLLKQQVLISLDVSSSKQLMMIRSSFDRFKYIAFV